MKRDLHDLLGVPVGAASADVDARYRDLGSPPELRQAWQILRDRHYAATYRAYRDVGRVYRAGFFDDDLPDGVSRSHVALPVTPTDKLSADGGTVLIATGAFSPVHEGHLAMMEAARTALMQAGERVAGGYLSPGHDRYVRQKHDCAPASERIWRCQLATNDSGWLMTSSWEAIWVPTAVNFTDVIEHIRHTVERHYGRNVQIRYVCGSDNAEFARAFLDHDGIVIVPRDHDDTIAAEVRADGLVRRAGRAVWTPPTSFAEMSSTAVRATTKPKTNARSQRTLALRDDLAWATAVWFADAISDPSPVQACREELVEVLGYGTGMPVRLVDIADQKLIAEDIARCLPTISLDPVVPGTHQLAVSRLFRARDAQCQAHALTNRPGSPVLDAQIQQIPPGDYALIDDDIATGFTVRAISQLLASHGIRVRSARGLLDWKPGDVVDARDFVLGCQLGGLVVDEHQRAPYMLPYVNLVTRASVLPQRLATVNRRLWEMNKRMFEALPITVRDCDEATARLLAADGWQPTVRLQEICAHWLHHFTPE